MCRAEAVRPGLKQARSEKRARGFFRAGRTAALVGLAVIPGACDSGPALVEKDMLSRPQAYVGSQVCKRCHLEHYDSWRATLHSRSLRDVRENQDALIVNIDPEAIRADLRNKKEPPKVPVEAVYVPKVEDIRYAIGVQWRQGFLVEKEGELYVAPVEYHIWSDHWDTYREDSWDQAPWTRECGGCHVTGLDLESGRFAEASIGCEACHGPGSHHVALPKTAVFEKRSTIVNPAALPTGLRTQICGSCHSRGRSKIQEDVHWPVGFRPGRALGPYYKMNDYETGDVKYTYANEFAKGHHQQYNDWKLSVHAREGVACTSCHYVHQIGVPPTQYQTSGSGSEQCMMCHKVINRNLAHSIHTFANCIGCHMPRIAKSAESGDIHSHVFVTLLPQDTIDNPAIPNSCQTCHKHRQTDLATLQELYEAVSRKSLLRVHQGL